MTHRSQAILPDFARAVIVARMAREHPSDGVAYECFLLGDAAVSMHPVTAHGYNFGIYGVESLTAAGCLAKRGGR